MVSTLGDVEAATVLIGGAGGSRGGASVTLEMRAQSELSAETASAVAGLVASATPGLTPEDVMVVDSRDAARSYKLSGDAGVASEGAAALRLRRDVERALADKLRALFTGMGIDCVAVVSVEIDLDRVKELDVAVDPKGTGGVVMKDERGYVRPSEARGASAGRPAALPRTTASRGGETRTLVFDVSRLTKEVTKAVGSVAKVRASVVYFDRRKQNADGTWSYDTAVGDKNREIYQRLAVRALGLEDNGDAVQVEYMPSASSKPTVADAGGRGTNVIAWAASATAVAIALIAGAVIALGRIRRSRTEQQMEATAAASETNLELSASEKLKRDVAKTAAEDVGRTAAILRRWIAREG
jgi:flagellar biosynthesis/type III secretory pathway M-ring protein FliF/YscJ